MYNYSDTTCMGVILSSDGKLIRGIISLTERVINESPIIMIAMMINEKAYLIGQEWPEDNALIN